MIHNLMHLRDCLYRVGLAGHDTDRHLKEVCLRRMIFCPTECGVEVSHKGGLRITPSNFDSMGG